MTWNLNQIESLKKRQNCGFLHPYTCENRCGDLIPTEKGWVCPECDYTQDWAYSSDLNWDWRKMNPFPFSDI